MRNTQTKLKISYNLNRLVLMLVPKKAMDTNKHITHK